MSDLDSGLNPPLPIKVIRSVRRKSTVSARLIKGVLEVRIPAHLSAHEEKEWAERMLNRLQRRRHGTMLNATGDLLKRAQELNQRYFEGELKISSVEYVTNQNTIHGSCTPHQGTIRLSHRLARLPAWVRDYVLVHELAHLLVPNHSRSFWRLVRRYPLTERARGYLMAAGLEEENAD